MIFRLRFTKTQECHKRYSQESRKDLRWRGFQQKLKRLKVVNDCCKALYLRTLRGS